MQRYFGLKTESNDLLDIQLGNVELIDLSIHIHIICIIIDSCGLNVQYIGSYICIHCLVTSVVGGNYWVKWRVFLFYSPGM